MANLKTSWGAACRALDKKAGVDRINADIKKALDCVPHFRTLHKFNDLGICGRLHSWLHGFLTKRTLRVKVGEKYSKCIDVTSGVLRGSVLGPVLVLLYITDCLNGLACDAGMFADDVKI